jgi:hypothetical protein
MKKSKKMLTICGRIVVSLCVCMAACCAQDYEEMHTVLVSDTIHSIESESDILSETTPITRSISFCEETQCYDGVFLSLYTDYAKSELTTDMIPLNETADIVISGTFITDTSGDMVRLIVRFYGDGIFLSENVQKGITLTDCITDITQNVTIPTECDSIIIAIQAKYDSKKGGSRSDVVEFGGLQVSAAEEKSEPQETELTDVSAEEADDAVNGRIIILTNLKTDYGKCQAEIEPINVENITDVTIDALFISDSSGDMVRIVVTALNSEGDILENKALTGMRLVAAEPTIYRKRYSLPKGTAIIRINVQAKYETKSGGSKDDKIIADIDIIA